MKILFHYNDYSATKVRKKKNAYGGVGYYRIFKPYEAMRMAGHDVTLVGKEIEHFGNDIPDNWDKIFQQFDVFYTSYGFSHLQTATAIFAFAFREFSTEASASTPACG